MDFRKFSSIENTYRKEYIDKVRYEGYGDETFIVQEKAHGANLSIWTVDGQSFRIAKRTAFLEEGETFFNYEEVIEKLNTQLSNLWKAVFERYEAKDMVLYGELLGGYYPHPEVDKVKGAVMVQKGVYYTPENLFYAFDLTINEGEIVPVEEANALFEEFGFFYAKTLCRGSLEEVLAYPNEFETTLPKLLGYPFIEGNTCEGTIIRPVNEIRLRTGKRVLFKNKNEKWSEIKKVVRKPEGPKEPQVVTPVMELQKEIILYVTENRLENVISKIGDVSEKDLGKLMGLFCNDVIEEFEKDFEKRLAAFEKKERKQITKYITPKVLGLVKDRIRK